MSDASEPRPAFSVVVPTRARPLELARCVRAIGYLLPPDGGFELIVVDDDPGSPPGDPLPPGGPEHARRLRGGGRGPAAARNLGAAAARGARIAFTDDDCAPHRSWLTALGAALNEGDGRCAAGFTRNVAPGAASEASQIVVDALRRAESAGLPPGRLAFAASNNVAFHRAEFDSIGGFDESFPTPAGEDRELCARWLAAGREIAEVPGAVVDHRHQLGPASLWRQHLAYGRGARGFHGSGASEGSRIGLQGRFWRELSREVRSPRLDGGGERAAVAGMLVATQLANAAGYLAGPR